MRKRLATFTGTPTQFLAQARVFAEEYPHLLFIALDGRVYVRSEDWTPLVTVGPDRPGASALITPRELPNGQCNLLLRDLVGDGARLEKQVTLFLDWLHQEGWITVMGPALLLQALMAIRATDAWQQATIQQVRRLVDGDQSAAAQPEIDGRPEPAALDKLTDREKEVASLLAKGLRQRDIAKTMMVEPSTVKTYFQKIAVAWNTGTTSQKTLCLEAKRRGYGG